MIHVLAIITARPGQRDAVLEAFRANRPNVLAEDGCIEYAPTIDVPTGIAAQGGVRENVATIVEKWESLAALEAHLVAPHMQEYRGRVKDMVVGSSLQILEPA